jgi:hypothetical protein
MSIASVKQSLINGATAGHRRSCTAIELRHGRGGTTRHARAYNLKMDSDGTISGRMSSHALWIRIIVMLLDTNKGSKRRSRNEVLIYGGSMQYEHKLNIPSLCVVQRSCRLISHLHSIPSWKASQRKYLSTRYTSTTFGFLDEMKWQSPVESSVTVLFQESQQAIEATYSCNT